MSPLWHEPRIDSADYRPGFPWLVATVWLVCGGMSCAIGAGFLWAVFWMWPR